MGEGVGDQKREARADAEESFVFRDHHGVLEFDGRNLLARRVDAMGNSKLRQRPAAAGRGHRTRRKPSPVSKHSRRLGVPGKLTKTHLNCSREACYAYDSPRQLA